MTAITANNTAHMETKQLPQDGYQVDYPVAASTSIYKDSFVGLDGDGYLTSYVAPAVYTGATSTGTSFRGIAIEEVDNSSGSDGDLTCRTQIAGYFQYALSSLAVTDIGSPVYATDNATLSMDSATGGCVGTAVGLAASGVGIFKLDPWINWSGKFLTVYTPTLDLPTVNQKILMVHATDNLNGLLLATCSAYTVEVHACADAQGVVTIQHTADTSMGCTLTAIDNSANLDSIVGAGGQLWAPASATDDAIVKAPAGKEVNAEVTTASAEAAGTTGQVRLAATFIRL